MPSEIIKRQEHDEERFQHLANKLDSRKLNPTYRALFEVKKVGCANFFSNAARMH